MLDRAFTAALTLGMLHLRIAKGLAVAADFPAISVSRRKPVFA